MSESEISKEVVEKTNMFLFNCEKVRYTDPVTKVITILIIWKIEDLGDLNEEYDLYSLLDHHYKKEFPNHIARFRDADHTYTGHYTDIVLLFPRSRFE